jgi:hypothetical protein
MVRDARRERRDSYHLDVAGLFDRLAFRRSIESELARPLRRQELELPPALTGLNPLPNSRFFATGPGARTAGGLFSPDGVHPTTIGYASWNSSKVCCGLGPDARLAE